MWFRCSMNRYGSGICSHSSWCCSMAADSAGMVFGFWWGFGILHTSAMSVWHATGQIGDLDKKNVKIYIFTHVLKSNCAPARLSCTALEECRASPMLA